MSRQDRYSADEPTRATIDATQGAVVVEFGTNWCGFCSAAQPLLVPVFAQHAQVTHIKVEDGPGQPLGRSFRVKLWPTLIFLRDGVEVARLVRPINTEAIRDAFIAIDH